MEHSLPCMNTLIAGGCIICLACVPLFGIDGELYGATSYTTMCQVSELYLSTVGVAPPC